MSNVVGQRQKYFPILDALRGFAAISVCLFHFTRDGRVLPPSDLLARVGSFGWLGVEVFFVISGFVIPWSMEQRRCRLGNAGAFLLRRLKRIEPPYFASIALEITLPLVALLVPGFRGTALDFTWPQLFAHIAYMNSILGYTWINPVYWTLAIEFQFYFFLAIAFPLLIHEKRITCCLSTPLLALLGFGGFQQLGLLLHWLPLFCFGLVSFRYCAGIIGWNWFIAAFVWIGAVCLWVDGVSETLAAAGTSGVILCMRNRHVPPLLRPLASMGTISYSFYLLHEPIGNRIMNLTRRLPQSVALPEVILLAAMVGAVVCSWGFWRLVEWPSQKWASGPRDEAPGLWDREDCFHSLRWTGIRPLMGGSFDP